MNALMLTIALELGGGPALAVEPAELDTPSIEPSSAVDDPEIEAIPPDLSARITALEARFSALEARMPALDAPPAPPSPPQVVEIERDFDLDFDVDDDTVLGLEGASVAPGVTVPEIVAMSGPVTVYGRVEDSAVSFGGDVRLFPGAVVEGDVVSFGGDVFVPSGAVVEGDAVSFGGRVMVEEGGEVEGDRVALGGEAAGAAISDIPHWEGAMRPAPLSGWLSGLGRRIAMLLGFAGAGVLVVGLWPRNVTQVSRAVVEHPVWYGVAGAILTASLSLGALLLTITLLGIPVAMFLLGLLAVAWLLGLVAFCSAAGEHLPLAKERGSWAAFLAGAGLLAVLAMVPVIGSVVVFALGFPAVGAALLTRLGSRVESPA